MLNRPTPQVSPLRRVLPFHRVLPSLALVSFSLPCLAIGCGGLLELDGLSFDGDAGVPGVGGSAGNTGGNAGMSGSGASGGGASGASGSAGSAGSAGASGSAGSSAGSAGASGSAGNGASGGSAGAPPCEGFGSEFDTARSLDCFEISVPSGTTHRLEAGRLVIEPVIVPWFGASEGAFFYQDVGSVNFAAAAHVQIRSLANPGVPPGNAFAGGGIALRSSGSSGAANNLIASVTTYSPAQMGGALAQWTLSDVSSNQQLQSSPPFSGWIGLCRAAGSAGFYSRMDSESTLSTVQELSNGPGVPGLSSLTELGVAAHIFSGSSADTRVSIDQLRVATAGVSSLADCPARISELIAAQTASGL